MFRLRKVAVVIRREYLSRVRTKAFWISTLAFPAVILAFAILPNYLAMRSGGSYTVALVSDDPELSNRTAVQVRERMAQQGDEGGAVVITLREEPLEADGAAQRTRLKREIADKQLSGALFVTRAGVEKGRVEYLTTNTSAWRLMGRLEGSVGAGVRRMRLEGEGVAPERIEALVRGVDVSPVKVGKDLSENQEGVMQSFFLSYILMFLLWMSVMIYGMYVMRGVLEEKSSRIVEVIVGNLSPTELMVGKIAGVGAVGLTQYLIWTLIAINLAVPGLASVVLGATAPTITPAILFFFVLFFVLGYVLYSTFYAALGAAFNSEEEAQQMQSVAGWIIGLPFVLMFPVINNPDSTLAVVFSLIPFFAPVLFFLRISVQTPPVWQTVLCIGLLLATIVAMARFAAAVYRVGILMYGKKPTVKEIIRWMRSS
ncbi:MAG: ABC transporter permease [Acidobacteriota bacterium]